MRTGAARPGATPSPIAGPVDVSGRTAVGLKPGSYSVDLDEILSAVAGREAPETLLHQERLAEALLAGYDDLDPSFHVWLMARRQGLHDRLIRGLEDGYRDSAVDARRRRLQGFMCQGLMWQSLMSQGLMRRIGPMHWPGP